jgi:hypothetical protein
VPDVFDPPRSDMTDTASPPATRPDSSAGRDWLHKDVHPYIAYAFAVASMAVAVAILWLASGLDEKHQGPYFAASTFFGVMACHIVVRTARTATFGPLSFIVRAVGGAVLVIVALERWGGGAAPYLVVGGAVALEALGQYLDHRYASRNRRP